MKATGWLKGLQVTADGTGIVSHAGVALIRALADNIADAHGPVDSVGVTTPAHARIADGRGAPHATFVRPDLGSFCRLDELGLQVAGQRLEPGRAVLACRIVDTDKLRMR